MPTPPKPTATKPKKPAQESTRPTSVIAELPEPVPVSVESDNQPSPVAADTAEEPNRVYVMEEADATLPARVEEEAHVANDDPVANNESKERIPSDASRGLAKLIKRVSGRKSSSAKSLTSTNPMFFPTAPTDEPVVRRPVLADDGEDESDSAMMKQLALEMAM
jgi:hypothetical protein